jgi:hypothetical protein
MAGEQIHGSPSKGRGVGSLQKIEFFAAGRKPSLVDVFHALRFRHFPSPQVSFTVYFVLYDGMGEGIIELKITRMENEEDVVAQEEKIVLPGRAMHRNCLLSVSCSFPAPGNHAISLRFREENQDMPNDLPLRFLDVFQD